MSSPKFSRNVPKSELAGTPYSALQSAHAPIASSEIDLAEIFRMLWRRKWLILGIVLSVMVLTIIILQQITPRYTAEALLMIEAESEQVVNVEAVRAGLPQDSATVPGEVAVFRSRDLAGEVVEQLNLDQDPEFNARLRQPSWLAQYKRKFAAVLGITSSEAEQNTMEAGDIADKGPKDIRYTVNAFLKNLSVSQEEKSRVISVRFTSANPETAATVANTIGQFYIDQQVEAKYFATGEASVWLGERATELRKKAEQSEVAVEQFREKHGLLKGSRGVTLIEEEISQLNSELAKARSNTSQAETSLREIKKIVNSQGGGSAGKVLESRFIQGLREQEAVIERELAQLSTEYGELHPTIISRREQIAQIREKINAEINKVIRTYENDVAIARAQEASLSESLAELKEQLGNTNEYAVRLRLLEQEAEANRQLYQTMLTRLKETTAQQTKEAQQPDARFVSYANEPVAPSFPRKSLILPGVFGVSSVFALLFAFVLERAQHGFRSGEEIERATGIPSLGIVPLVRGIGKNPADVLKKWDEALSASMRGLYTSVRLSRTEAPKSILFTSSHPGEGKTTIAVALARQQALAKSRVIIIDMDIWHPSVHDVFGFPRTPGLVEVLFGEASLKQTICVDEQTGVHLLPAGSKLPRDTIDTERMRQVIAKLAQYYDLVVVDAPPVAAVPEVQILPRYVDAMVFVVRWVKTRREVIDMALNQLKRAGAPIAGIVLSMVDAKKHAQYHYGDSGYYTGNLARYYK